MEHSEAYRVGAAQVVRRLLGTAAVVLGVASGVAADAPQLVRARSSTPVVRELVLECQPGDVPVVEPLLTTQPDEVSLRLSCDGLGQVGLRNVNTGPLKPGDHVLWLSVTSDQGSQPGLDVGSDLHSVTVTATGTQPDGVSYRFLPDAVPDTPRPHRSANPLTDGLNG